MADELTTAGLQVETLQETLQSLEDSQRADVDPGILTGATALAGQWNGIYASDIREVREVVQELADSIDPDNAEGDRLDAIAAITGTKRRPASYSKFVGSKRVTVNLNAGFTLVVGSQANVLEQPDVIFETTEEVTNGGGSPADVLVSMRATVTGPVVANANTLTVITNPVAGWNSVLNTTDAILGAPVQPDQDLRATREAELTKGGSTSTDAIRADLLALETEEGDRPIIDAVVYENVFDFWFQGRPPHSIEVVIWDGPGEDAENLEIATILYKSKAAGIRTVGVLGTLVEDSYGNNHIIAFSRATQVSVEIEVTLEYGAGYVGDAEIKSRIAQAFSVAVLTIKGTKQAPGKDAKFSAYMAVASRDTGVVGISLWSWGIAGGPPLVDFTDLVAGEREIFVVDTADITVNSSPV